MPTEFTCWSVDALSNSDDTRNCSTRRACTTRCGGSRLADARRWRRGSESSASGVIAIAAAAELPAWTAEGGCPYADGRGARHHTTTTLSFRGLVSRLETRWPGLLRAGVLSRGWLDPASCARRWTCR